MANSTFETVQRIVAEAADVDPARVTIDADIVNDLEADSRAVLELIMALETEYGFVFEEDEYAGLKTVGDIVTLIDSSQA
jgi:acyl carrier protein